MGGLFSSNDNLKQHQVSVPAPPTRPNFTNTYRADSRQSFIRNNYPRTEFSRINEEVDTITREFQNLQIAGRTRRIQNPEASKRNVQIFGLYNSWHFTFNVVSFIQLETYDPEYLQIIQMITNKKNFKVDSVERIINPYLEKAYELKKEQKKRTFPYLEERLLFHGTKQKYVDNICKMNFNWRHCQTHKYGKGISFSPNSTYASVYSDENVYDKVMLVAKVMIGRSCIGNKDMDLPPEGCDTSQKGDDAIVVVKFEDNEFHPVYKINYHLKDETVGKKPNYKHRRRGRRQIVF